MIMESNDIKEEKNVENALCLTQSGTRNLIWRHPGLLYSDCWHIEFDEPGSQKGKST